MMLTQTKVRNAGIRIALALVLSLILFLPVAYASNTITLTSPNALFMGHFGSSVAVNEGDPIVVVGAPLEKAGVAVNAGNAYVLDTSTGSIITLTDPNLESKGYFGTSVAVSGTTVVVGAPGEDASAGNAYVFDATDGSFITQLTSPNPLKAGGGFGQSVSISGTTVVVGAPFESAGTPSKSNAGNAYVFDAATGSWITTLTSPSPGIGGFFGYSVAVSGTTVVVGAWGESSGGHPLGGNAYVFDATDGSRITTLTSPSQEDGGEFGASVSVSATMVVVGAPGEKVGGKPSAGNAYVFDATTWSPLATLTSPYPESGALFGDFGISVAVGGTTVVVGAPVETADGQFHGGHAYVFDASTGFLPTTLRSSNPQAPGEFGSSVAVNQCDPTVVVGAPRESGGGFSEAGHAYIFFL